jgi:O-antigen ligase
MTAEILKQSKDRLSFKIIAWSTALVFFLIPISADVGGGTSVNYAFLGLLIFATSGYKYSTIGALYCGSAIVSYLLGIILFSKADDTFLIRQLISFLLALCPALLLFVRLKFTLDQLVKVIIFVSCAYSAYALYSVLVNDFTLFDLYAIKGNLREFITDWPQRYVVVLMMGIFLSFERIRLNHLNLLFSILIFIVIFLTFTRAVYISIFVGGIGYWACSKLRAQYLYIGQTSKFVRMIIKFKFLILFGILFFVATNEAVSHAIGVMFDATIGSVADGLSGNVTSADESESTRLDIWSTLASFILQNNPLFGSGHAGGYLIFSDEYFGSAHSQYVDIFFRTGVVGTCLYFLLWFQLVTKSFRVSPGLFAGCLAILVFGFFHETTKLSYGSFLFFILLNLVTEIKQLRLQSNEVRTIC